MNCKPAPAATSRLARGALAFWETDAMRFFALLLTATLTAPAAAESELVGLYMEARTCQVYTGPCFANAEMGLAGKDALMAWHIEGGESAGCDLRGLSVVAAVAGDATLGFDGLRDADELRAVLIVDEQADEAQREALVAFARGQLGAAAVIVEVRTSPIEFELDRIEAVGRLAAGNLVRLETRKARPGDCICTNEVAFYPPLAATTGCLPAVVVEGDCRARALGARWSIPGDRSAYLGQFAAAATPVAETQLAAK